MTIEFDLTDYLERNFAEYFVLQMAAQQVQAVIDVKPENFHQVIEESIATDQTSSYEQLIAANERLKMNISKIFTEFVNKARLEQEANGDQKKRKIKRNLAFYSIERNFVFCFSSR